MIPCRCEPGTPVVQNSETVQQDSGRYKAGVYITSLVNGGGAEAAGLKVYDRIVKVDDTDITSYTDLSAVLSSHKIGDKVSVTVERDGKEKTYDVTLGSSAAE